MFPAPLPGMPPPGPPIYGGSMPCVPWLSFQTKLGREPDDPLEFQQWTFFNTSSPNLTNSRGISYWEAYIIFMEKSTNKTKKEELTKMHHNGSLLVFSSTCNHLLQWLPTTVLCINNNSNDQQCLFASPNLNHLYHKQTAQYIAFNNSRLPNANKNKPKCDAGHMLYHTSPNELYTKHPAYFNGQFIGFLCNGCRVTFPYTYAWHCALCQYDLCATCYTPGVAPMAPYMLHHKVHPVTARSTAVPTAATLPSPLQLLVVPPLVNTNMDNAFALPYVHASATQLQHMISQYEDKFIYNNLSQYISFNQDIYHKLQAFNAKKRYINQVRYKSPTHRLENVGEFVSRNIDIFKNEKQWEKVKMTSIDIWEDTPFTVCYKIESKSGTLHHKLKKALNEHQTKYNTSDIYPRRMTDKGNDISNRKWSVKGIVDPDKHLSTLQHSTDVFKWQHRNNIINTKFDCISYYHWIPTVFRVNDNVTKCELISEIPNLDPYEYKNTLYPLISELFLSFVKQFEYISRVNLRGYDLQCVIKVQDYIIKEIKEDDTDSSYYGNFHKEGLYEDIMAVGLYYYDISPNIKGGELELTVINSNPPRPPCPGMYFPTPGNPGRSFISHVISVSEATQLVFNNYKCFHRVNKLYGDGNRKIIAFHLINPSNRLISAKHIVVNWKYHAIHYVTYFCRILLNNDNVGFMFNIVVMYVVGDKEYIEETTEIHNECRRRFFQQKTDTDILHLNAPPALVPPPPFNAAPIPD